MCDDTLLSIRASESCCMTPHFDWHQQYTAAQGIPAWLHKQYILRCQQQAPGAARETANANCLPLLRNTEHTIQAMISFPTSASTRLSEHAWVVCHASDAFWCVSDAFHIARYLILATLERFQDWMKKGQSAITSARWGGGRSLVRLYKHQIVKVHAQA